MSAKKTSLSLKNFTSLNTYIHSIYPTKLNNCNEKYSCLTSLKPVMNRKKNGKSDFTGSILSHRNSCWNPARYQVLSASLPIIDQTIPSCLPP